MKSGPLILVPKITTQENVIGQVSHVQCHNKSRAFTNINALMNGLGLPPIKSL